MLRLSRFGFLSLRHVSAFLFALLFVSPLLASNGIYEDLEVGDPLRSGLTGGLITGNPEIQEVLDRVGVSVGITQIMDYAGNTAGGIQQAFVYDGLFNVEMDFDLAKSLGFANTRFHLNGAVTQGQNLSDDIGNIFIASSIADQYHVARLVDAWVERTFFDDRIAVRGGQMVAQNIFATNEAASLFINATFAYPFIFAVNLPQDGATYVDAVPGALVRWMPHPTFTWQTAVFNALPSGGTSTGNRYGLEFPIGDGAMTWSELIFMPGLTEDSDDIPSVYKIGAWYNPTTLNPTAATINGQSFATPGEDKAVHGTYSMYLSVERDLWRSPYKRNQSIRGFFRAASNPQVKNNVMTGYLDAGLSFAGLSPRRPNDEFGLAVAWGNISPAVNNQIKQYNQYYSENAPLPTSESVFEVTYLAPIDSWWSLQPFFQYILNPGAGTANPSAPNQKIPNATIAGIRMAINF